MVWHVVATHLSPGLSPQVRGVEVYSTIIEDGFAWKLSTSLPASLLKREEWKLIPQLLRVGFHKKCGIENLFTRELQKTFAGVPVNMPPWVTCLR